MNSVPIIRLELDRMKESILVALTERQFALDSQIKEALDRYLESSNVQAIVNEAVFKACDAIIKQETESFFLYGDGSRAIRSSIQQALNKDDKSGVE